jgi:uncharacterized protein (TIGR02231 family)
MTILESLIAAVTVYTNKARVTRLAKTNLKSGQHTLSIINLPDSLDEKSVRVSGKGANIKILSVEVDRKIFAVTPDGDIADLESNLKEFNEQLRALDDALAILANRLSSLNQFQQNVTNSFAQPLGYGRISVEQLDSTLKYLNKEILEIKKDIRDTTNKRQNIFTEISLINNRLTRLKVGETKRRWEVQVFVEALEDSSLELEVTYLISGASWSPLYDVRLVENQVTLSYLANVTQSTGEEWQNIKLSLSTAQPAISTVIPELSPWYIPAKQQPKPYEETKSSIPRPQAMARAKVAMDSFAEDECEQEPQITMEVAVVESSVSSGNVTFHINKLTSIPSDGTPHKNMVALIPLEAKLDYVVVPKLTTEAYLRATIKNTSESTFLAGTVNIFHGEDFIGTTQIKNIATNEEFKIQLGVDNRIKVARKLSERTVSKSFLGGSKRYTVAYTTTITNNLKTATKITVHDQLPIAYNEQLKIKAGEILPKPTEHDDMQMIKWELDFKAEEKREVLISFTLDAPREISIPGIDY